MSRIRIATRGSELALAQADYIASRIRKELARETEIVVVKTTGDGVLACFDGAARAVRCAQALVTEAKRLGVPVRAGVHVGECERRGDDIGGMTVHVAARVLTLAKADEVLATSTVREALVGTGIGFELRGTQALRGVPGTWSVFAVHA